MRAYRTLNDNKSIIIVSLSDFSKDAKTFCANINDKVMLLSGEDILNMADSKDMLPDEKQANERVVKEMNETIVTLKKVKNTAFGRAKVKAYVICGIVIMCWPLVSGFRFYYPIIAVICFVMAFISYKKSHREANQPHIGIY